MTAKTECDLAVSCLGALVWYLMSSCLEEPILTQKQFVGYVPQDLISYKLDSDQMEVDEIPNFISSRQHMVSNF